MCYREAESIPNPFFDLIYAMYQYVNDDVLEAVIFVNDIRNKLFIPNAYEDHIINGIYPDKKMVYNMHDAVMYDLLEDYSEEYYLLSAQERKILKKELFRACKGIITDYIEDHQKNT